MGYMIDEPLPVEKRSEGFRVVVGDEFHIGKAEDDPVAFRQWMERRCKEGKAVRLDMRTMTYVARPFKVEDTQNLDVAEDDGLVIPFRLLPRVKSAFKVLKEPDQLLAINSFVHHALEDARRKGIGGAVAEKVDEIFADHGATSTEDLDPSEYVECYHRMRTLVTKVFNAGIITQKTKKPSASKGAGWGSKKGRLVRPSVQDDDDDDDDDDF